MTERSSRTRNEDVDRAERRRERQKWRMEARERDQRSRGTRVDNPSRALPHAFSNERMVRVGTRGIMFDGCCRPGRKATRCSVSSTKSDGEIIGRPLESKVCPIICCGLKAEPPERGRGTPRDSRTSRRRKNDEVLGTLEPLRHSQGLDDERLPPKDPFRPESHRRWRSTPSTCPYLPSPSAASATSLPSTHLERVEMHRRKFAASGAAARKIAEPQPPACSRGKDTGSGETGGQARTSLGHVTGSNAKLARGHAPLLIFSCAARPSLIEKRRGARRAWVALASPHA